MSNSNDDPGSDSTLPPPELNPLLNPLLSRNMGRWAEVFFTNPPERRDAAMLELLRELQDEPSVKQEQSHQEEIPEESLRKASPESESVAGATSKLITCTACGESNPGEQKFCSGCGAALVKGATLVRAEHQDSPLQARVTTSIEEPASFPSNQFASTALLTPPQSDGPGAGDDWGQPTWGVRGEAPKLIPEYNPVSYRFRIYFGTALAVLITTLVYMSWRGTQVWSRTSHPLPEAAPAAEVQHPAQPPAPIPPKANGAAAESQGVAETAGGEAKRTQPSPTAEAKANEGAVSQAALKGPLEEQSAQGGAPQKTGSTELAIAEHYLNGTQGRARDSSEAAKWLWQSVGKQNSAAIVLLSDLYLRGDGVPKSCDQARLLLDAAARKGAAGAADRLRNLRAFGCE